MLFNFGMAFTTRIPVLNDRKGGILLFAGKLLHRFERIRDRGKRILSHGGFIFRNRVQQGLFPAMRLQQLGSEQSCVFQRDVPADTAIGRHAVNGVTQQSDLRRLPGDGRRRSAQMIEKELLFIDHFYELAEIGVPGGHGATQGIF